MGTSVPIQIYGNLYGMKGSKQVKVVISLFLLRVFSVFVQRACNISLYQILLNVAAKTPVPIAHFKLYQILLHIAEKLLRQHAIRFN